MLELEETLRDRDRREPAGAVGSLGSRFPGLVWGRVDSLRSLLLSLILKELRSGGREAGPRKYPGMEHLNSEAAPGLQPCLSPACL